MTLLDIAQGMRGRLRDGYSPMQAGVSSEGSAVETGTAVSDSVGGYVDIIMDGAPTDDPGYPSDFIFTVPCDAPIVNGNRVSYISANGYGKAVALESLSQIAEDAGAIATATNQHFWHRSTDPDGDGAGTGAFVTDETKDDFLAASAAGFPLYDPDTKPYRNILINSLGVLLRSALYNLASFTKDAVTFFDGTGNDQENIVATFGATGAQIGGSSSSMVKITANGMTLSDDGGVVIADMEKSSSSMSETVTEQFGILSSPTSYTLSHTPASGATITARIWDRGGGNVSSQMTFTQGTASSQSVSDLFVNATLAYDGSDGFTLTSSVTGNRYELRIRFSTVSYYPPYFTFGTRYGTPGAFSATIGRGLIADSYDSVAIGEFNDDTGAPFMIGGGSDDNNRVNIFKVDGAGNVTATGSMTLGSPLAITQGGTGAAAVSSDTTISNIITAGTGITITEAHYHTWGKVAMLMVGLKRSSAISAGGAITIGSVASGHRPVTDAAGSSNTLNGWLSTGGNFTARNITGSQIAANTDIYISLTYLLP